MLQTRIRKSLESRGRADAPDSGFTLIELLVVILIIGVLSSIAIPVFLGQRQRAYDATVQSDMKNLATAAETSFTANLAYPTLPAGFSTTSATTPIVSPNNTYVAYVTPTGADAGYVIIGKNANSDKYFVLSSYNGGAPVASAATSLAAVQATLTAANATYKNPALWSTMTSVTVVGVVA